ncbi:MAG: nitroreductase [Gammaproteobacteria bacterium]|nr:nitroreductase [Gammaproteobacteria bacterium]
MNVSEAIRHRRTVRGFRQDPIPDEVLHEILDAARFSPSNCNTQPWHLTVISGDARDRLEHALIAEITSGKSPAPAFQPGDAALQGVYKERQVECAMEYFSTMGIAREDRGARNALSLKNWQFFGAPHVGILSMPKCMGEVNAIDLGIYLQSLMLLLVENGLASCPQGALAFYPDPIFEIASLPEDHGIICGISFGYEEKGARINKARMPRAPLEDTVKFVN